MIKLVRISLAFGVGVYLGIYLDQNYQIPRVDDPQGIWNKIKEYTENYKKDK